MSDGTGTAESQKQLVEIFRSCDTGNKGFLSLLELDRLCRQLQIQTHRQRLYKALGLSRLVGGSKQVYFEDFKTALVALLQEVGPDVLATEGKVSASLSDLDGKGTDKETDLHLHLPADMIDDDDVSVISSDETSHRRPKISPPSPLKRAFMEDSGDDSHAGKQRRGNHGQVETFEAEGQLVWSPEPSDYLPEWDRGLEQLRHVCRTLGVGHQGHLTRDELGQVCHYIGMEHMNDEELNELYHKLDVDQDGLISFDEFVQGLSHHANTTTITTPRGFSTPTRTPRLWPNSGRKVRTPLPPAQQDKQLAAVAASGDSVSLFSSLHTDDAGFVSGEAIMDHWEKLNISHGAELLMSLGFDPHSKMQVRDVSAALRSEWCDQLGENNSLSQAVTAIYHHELQYLRSGLDQTSEERNKLRSDLADALSRNALMAAEVDERHVQLEKSFDSRLKSVDKEYQEQLKHSQAELAKEREAQNSQSALLKQSSEQIQELQQRVSLLREQLAESKKEVSKVQKEASQSRDKQKEWQNQCSKLQKQLEQQQSPLDSPGSSSWETEKQSLLAKTEQYAVENKALKDRNDELVAQLEDLQHRPPSSRRNSMGSQGRSASTSRIPVKARASSFSSDTSEWEDEDSFAEMYYGHGNAADSQTEQPKTPSLGVELKQQEEREKENRSDRPEDAPSNNARDTSHSDDRKSRPEHRNHSGPLKDKTRMWEQFQRESHHKLAEQRRELQEAFGREKEELLQQFDSRQSLRLIQHREQLEALENRLKEAEQQNQEKDSAQDPVNLYTKTRVQELEKVKGDLEKQLRHWKQHYEAELQSLRAKYDDDLARLKANRDHRVRMALEKMFEQGASGLKGKLKEDFDHLVQQQRHKNTTTDDNRSMDKEEMYSSFEQEKMRLVQHYESQIMGLQEEINSLQQHFEAERAAFQQLQSGELAQSIRQELQIFAEMVPLLPHL